MGELLLDFSKELSGPPSRSLCTPSMGIELGGVVEIGSNNKVQRVKTPHEESSPAGIVETYKLFLHRLCQSCITNTDKTMMRESRIYTNMNVTMIDPVLLP